MLVNPDNNLIGPETAATQEAARGLGLQITVLSARNEQEVRTAFATLIKGRAGALLVGSDPLIEARHEQLIELAAHHAVPTLYAQGDIIAAGGLASYGANIQDAYREAGVYAGRILKGAIPAELPVLQPNRVELVINLRTAKALGLTIPQSLRLRADEVIR